MRRFLRKWLFLALLVTGLLVQFSTFAATNRWDPNAGFIYDRFDLTLSPGERIEAAGPFYYREMQESRRIWALPPLLTFSQDPETQSTEFDLAYPLLSYIRSGDQYRWQILQLLSFAGGPTQNENERDRITLFPLFFWQRSSDTNQNYTGYGPFYGRLQNRLFRDEIDYVLFPLYSRTRKKDVVTWNYLFPIFHIRKGNELRGWQVWPLFGQETKKITQKTDGFGDVEMIPGHKKLFAAWPIFNQQTTGIGSTNETWQQAALPLYYLTRSPARDQTTVLWPFFSKIEEREKHYTEWHAPWPFVVLASGEGKSVTRFLPLYSHAETTNQESTVYLWPAYRSTRLRSDPLDRRRTRILFFLYSSTTDRNTETGRDRWRREFWPLYTAKKDLNGNKRLQVLAILEPFLPRNENVELEYSPVYSVWRSEQNPSTQSSSQSLLWNLYRRSKSPKKTEVSALFGLFRYTAEPEKSRLRLFYIPVK